MLTLAFAQIVWAICFKWNEVTGGEQGMPNVPYPDFGWMARAARWLGGLRTAEYFYFLTLVLVAASASGVLRRIVDSPFGRMLTAIRENPERARVHRRQRAALPAGGVRRSPAAFAGLAGGALRHLQPRRLPRLRLLDRSRPRC